MWIHDRGSPLAHLQMGDYHPRACSIIGHTAGNAPFFAPAIDLLSRVFRKPCRTAPVPGLRRDLGMWAEKQRPLASVARDFTPRGASDISLTPFGGWPCSWDVLSPAQMPVSPASPRRQPIQGSGID